MAALSATTRDLAEFVNVVQEDTTKAASDAAYKVKQIINKVRPHPPTISHLACLESLQNFASEGRRVS